MRQSQNGFGKDFGLVGKSVRRYLATTALTASGFLALVSPAMADNWTDHTGTGITVDTSTPNTTNITQSLDIVKVSGDGDINAGWTVNVAQPSSSSKYVLYDIEGDPVNIMGNLNANGQIYIFDQNGVIFGAGSQVNVGSIVASTGMISDANLADNKMVFENVGGNGQIALNGTINVAQAGLAAFVAPTIINNGIINAKLGTVAMASGEKVTLDLYGDNLVEITVDGALENSLIENKGTIRAEGGTIAITAAAAKDAVDSVINMEGVTDVSSVIVKGGKIILGGGSKGTVKVAGKLDASGTTGGDIKVTGQTVDVSGDIVNDGDESNTYLYGTDKAIFTGNLRVGKEARSEISGEELVLGGNISMGENSWISFDPASLTVDAGNVATFTSAMNAVNAIVNIEARNRINIDVDIDTSTQTTNSVLYLKDENANADLRVDLNAKIILGAHQSLQGDATKVNVSAAGSVQNAVDVSSATNGSVIEVAPGNYVETATNRTLPWSPGATYNMGLFVDKDNITIRGVDALGNVITDPNNVLATIEAGDITNFGAMHGVVGNNVTFSGLKFTPKVGVRNKTIEVWGNNFTLKNSVVDNSNTATNPTGFSGLYENYGGGAVYIGDERYDAVTNTSSIRRFNLDGNIFIAGSVAITNGVGVVNNASSGAQRNITNNTFVGNGMDPTRADVVYNSGILLTGRQPTIAWRLNPIGAMNISGNTFDGTSAHVLARGEMVGSLDWNQIFTGNTFDKSAAAFESETLVRGEDYVVNGDARSDWRAIYNTIQWAVDGAVSGDTVNVGNGTYDENVVLNKSLTLQSVTGRDNTTINGISTVGALGTVLIGADVNNVNLGTAGKGFTINGIDNGSPGVENAAVYLQGAHDNISIKDNRIVAMGDEALVTEYSLVNSNMTIDNNIFTGTTYFGPAGTGDQFTDPNVPRQLVALNNGLSNLTFTNNEILGDSGLQHLVAIESDGATITGNNFDGTTTGSLLRLRGSDITVSDNDFDGNNVAANVIRASNVDGLTIGGASELEGNTIKDIAYGWNNSGINVLNGSLININYNDLDNIGGQGIYVEGPYAGPSTVLNIKNNTIDDAEHNAIYVKKWNGADIASNIIDDITYGHGVQLELTEAAKVSSNEIKNVAASGVNLYYGNNGATVDGNLIHTTGSDAIAVSDSTNTRIAQNIIGFTDFAGLNEGLENNINGDGIYAYNADGVNEGNTVITGNKITQTHSTVDGKGSGINVVNSEYVLIGGSSPEEANIVTKARWDGIRTDTKNGGVSQVITISGNNVDQIDRVGIYAANTSSLLINDNDVTNSTSQIGMPYGGISTDWGSYITVTGNRVSTSGQGVRMYNAGGSNFITGNDINSVTDNGIHVYDMLSGSNTEVSGNFIGYGIDRTFGTEDDSKIGARGIYALNAKDVLISGNSIGNTGGEGVWAENSTTLDVTGNVVDATGKAGIHLISATGPVDVSDNKIGLNREINGNGIYFTAMDGTSNPVLVQRNQISNTTGNDANGIYAESVTGAMIGGETDEDANILRNISWDGIKVYFGGANTIQSNTVSDTGRASIYAGKTQGVKILNNTVHDSDVFWIPEFAYGAITVTESSDTQIDQNIVTGGDESLAQTGIWSTDNTGFNSIFDNNVSDINGTGIFARNVNNLTINENDVYNVDGHGIHAVNIIDGLAINHNIIGGNGVQNRVYGNGIFVEDTDLVGRRGPMGLIQGNDIRNTRSEENNDSNGIFVKNSHGFVIGGIDFEQPPEDDDRDEQQYDRRALAPVLSTANVIHNTGWDGIRIQGGSDHIVIGNDLKNTARAGIFAKNVRRIAILDNTIVDSNWAHGGALAVEGGRHVIVAGNTITSLEDSKAGSGIYMQGTQGLTLIAKNTISDINGNDNRPGHGIYVDNVRTPRIIGNTVTNVYGDGIYVSGASVARILRNEVTDARLAGLHIAGPENEYVIVAGNVFTGNDIGAFFESGLIDLTRKGNEFIGGRVGIRFAPYFASNGGEEGGGDEGGFEEVPSFAKIRLSNLSLVDDDDMGSDPYVPGTVPTNYGGTLGAQIFKDQSEYYVELDKGAFFQPGTPTVLNATRSTFINTAQGFEITPEDFAGSLLPAGQIAFLESMFYHYPDGQAAANFQNLGVFFFGNALPVAPGSATNIDPRLIFTQFPFFNGDLTGLNVQIRGLPNLPGQGGGNSPASFNNIQTFAGNPSDLNNIETAAGGDNGQDGQDLNEIETQAGGEDESCWNTAANAAGQGQVVNVVYQGSFLDNMEASSSCSGE